MGPYKNGDRKQKERKKAIEKLFAFHANTKISFRNKPYSPYYVKVPRKEENAKSYEFFPVPAMVETATESL